MKNAYVTRLDLTQGLTGPESDTYVDNLLHPFHSFLSGSKFQFYIIIIYDSCYYYILAFSSTITNFNNLLQGADDSENLSVE